MLNFYNRRKWEQAKKQETQKIQKTEVKIAVRRGQFARQQADIEMIMKIIREIITATTREEVLIQSAIAVGYANAMQAHGVISEKELCDTVEMIGQTGEEKLEIIESMERNIIMRKFRKWVKK